MLGRHLQNRLAQAWQKSAFLKKRWLALCAWPVACCLTAALLWSATEHTIGLEEGRARQAARNSATALALSYAEQLQHTVQLLDQITMQVKYSWEKLPGQIDLDEQRRVGLFPSSSQLYVTVFDRSGKLVTSTVENARPISVADRDYFQAHRSAVNSLGLVISVPFTARLTNKTIINLSRALRDPGGRFDGLSAVSVEPGWLAAYYDLTRLGNRDMLLVRREGGPTLFSTLGGQEGGNKDVFLHTPELNETEGLRLLGGDWFADGVPRYLAWRKLGAYPLTAVAAVAIPDALRAQSLAARNNRNMAWVASAMLLLLAGVGVAFTIRLEWRRHQAEQVRALYGELGEKGGEAFYLVAPVHKDGVYSGDWQVVACNERGAEMYGLQRHELIGRRLSRIYRPEQLDKLRVLLEKALAEGNYEDEYEVSASSRLRSRWLRRKYTSTAHGVAIMLADISQRKAHETALSNMAHTDELTGLPNRQWLNASLPAAIERAREANLQLAVFFLDLDDFKNINDTLGHAAGDQLLRMAAVRLRSVIRPQDNAVRLGGDEFTVILEGINSEESARVVADRVVKSLREPWILSDGRGHSVHASIGMALFPRDGEDASTLLKHADIAMYAAKADGKGRARFFQPRLSEALVARINLRSSLRNAIQNDEFVLHYQPRVDCVSGALRGFEALLRWQQPGRGLVPPSEFIPLVEESDMASELGELVIRRVCQQLAKWQRDGVQPPPVSVNISPRHFAAGGVHAQLLAGMREFGLASGQLEIEITESSMMESGGRTDIELARLRQDGVPLLVDDFGIGHSSLSQLQNLQVDVLKIDRSFIQRVARDVRSEAMCMAIISMAHVLDMQVVAEGVETVEQLQVLRQLACNQIQGFLVSVPVSADQVPALMARQQLLEPVLVPAALTRA